MDWVDKAEVGKLQSYLRGGAIQHNGVGNITIGQVLRKAIQVSGLALPAAPIEVRTSASYICAVYCCTADT